jgi:SWI/SNF-related matrix-associated actin-dependent regulator of chromatin subfamily A-like protein 1
VNAKFAGTCATCGRRFPAGEPISWDPETRKASHETCAVRAAAAPAVQAQVAASRAIEVPADLVIPAPEGQAYLPFQRAGVAYMLPRYAVLLADDQGTGKTIQAAGYINALPGVRLVLVVTTKSLLLNWKIELEAWRTRPLTIGIADGKDWPSTDVVIVTWDMAPKLRPRIDAVAWDLVVVDEAHFGKNPKAARTRGVFGYEGKGRGKDRIPPDFGISGNRKLALTGTPIDNKPLEIYPMLRWLDPQAWPKSFDFGLRYCAGHQVKIGWNPFTKKEKLAWNFEGASNLPELQQRLRSTIMLRRLKAEVLPDLPPKRRQVVVIPAENAAIARAARAQMGLWTDFEAEREKLELYARKSKASADPREYAAAVARLDEAEEVAFRRMTEEGGELAKLKAPFVVDLVRDALEEAPGKVIIGVHTHEVADLIFERLEDFRPAVISGRVNDPTVRQAAVHRFQNDPDCRAFVGSIRAAGVGLTLTAANRTVFAELDWSPAAMNQFEDRAHRIGQTQSLLIQHVVVDGSLDSKKVARLIEKQKVSGRALDHDPGCFAPPDPLPEVNS